MAEEEPDFELGDLKIDCERLNSYFEESTLDSKTFCSTFCKLVEQYTFSLTAPLSLLRVLQHTVCLLVRASTSYPSDCDHVQYLLSSFALRVFEVLLFFDKQDFHQHPLKDFLVAFQECESTLAGHQNVHMLHVRQALLDGGPWASPVLQAILVGEKLPQEEVDRYIDRELPVHLELRVRYLFSCDRVHEAMALLKCCIRHPKARRHLFFYQTYLTWHCKGPHKDQLDKEIVGIDGNDAVAIICNMESHETDELLLTLSRAFLSQQLRIGDMYYMWDLVFIWSKLFRCVHPNKQPFLQETKELILSATNVKSIFLFMRVVLTEIGEEGIQFCVEMCANALQSTLPCDPQTKSHIYKTIASLLPRDLEVCQACALLVFFVERSVEAYRAVFLLYTQPDQEYNADTSPVGNHVRFEILQVLKKGLYFDPEFFNLVNLRTNCLKLMSEKVMTSALEEIKEEAWEPNHCTKDVTCCPPTHPADLRCHTVLKKRHLKKGRNNRRVKADNMQLSDIRHLNQKQRKISHTSKEASEFSRRSFRQLDSTQENHWQQFGPEGRRITRLSEKNPPKRKIRKPRWLLEDSGTLEENSAPQKVRKISKKLHPQKQVRVSEVNFVSSPAKNNAKQKTAVTSFFGTNYQKAKRLKRCSTNTFKTSPTQEGLLELSLPDNELTGIFPEETMNIHRHHKNHLHKPIAMPPSSSLPVKVLHRNAVVLRPKDASSFVQQLHCYARRAKGKGLVNLQASTVTAVTRSSVQGSVMNVPPRIFCENPEVEMKVTFAAQDLVEAKMNSQDLPERASVGADGTLLVLPCAGKNVKQKPTLCPPKPDVIGHIANNNVYSSETSSEPVFSDTFPSVQKSPLVSENIIVSEASRGTTVTGLLKEPSSLLLEPSCHEENISPPLPLVVVADVTTDANILDSKVCKKQLKGDVNSVSEDIPQILALFGTASGLSPEIQQGGHFPEVKVKQQRETVTPAYDKGLNENEFNVVTPDCSNPVIPPCELEEKLEYSCTLCNKVFKDKHVAAHAMFHYRKDRCMFCGMLFKDDLLAMMHMSEHIDKLKKSKKSVVHKVIEKRTLKNPVQAEKSAKPMHYRGGSKRSAMDLPVSFPSDHRKLRSNSKMTDGQLSSKSGKKLGFHVTNRVSQRKKTEDLGVGEQTFTSHEGTGNNTILLRGRRPVEPQAKSTTSPSQQENKPLCSLANQGGVKTQSSSAAKTRTVEKEPFVTEKPPAGLNKVCCSVEGCDWYTDLSRQRVTLLYHALEEHHGEERALKLAYRLGNSRCSVCMRTLLSFQHYLDHVGRHTLSPRHPCLHKGCGARFRTGFEMRRHSRRHSPLQAECCASGCSQLFACLWALNLHEREHYGSKPFTQTPDKSLVGNKLKDFDNEQGNKKRNQSAALPTNNIKKQKDTFRLTREPTVEPLSIVKDPKDAPTKTTRLGTRAQRLKVKKKMKDPKISKDMPFLGSMDAASKFSSSAHKFQSKKSLRRRQAQRKCWSVHSAENGSTVSSKNSNTIVKNSLKKQQGIKNTHASESRDNHIDTTRLNKKRIELDRSKTKKTQKFIVRSKSIRTNVQKLNSACYNTAAEVKSRKTQISPKKQNAEKKCPTNSAHKPRTKVCNKLEEKTLPITPTTEEQDKVQSAELYLRKKQFDFNKDTTITPSNTTNVPKEKCIAEKDSKKRTAKTLFMNSDSEFLSASKMPASAEDTASDVPVTKRLKSNVNPVSSNGDSIKANGQVNGIAANEAQTCIRIVESHGEENQGKQPGSSLGCHKEEKVQSHYGRRPYTRPPPTAYLDEQYTTMPKRRKMPFPYCASTLLHPVDASVPPQRQRCAKCFSSFDSREELQTHLSLKNCTSLFGFDSDEESK